MRRGRTEVLGEKQRHTDAQLPEAQSVTRALQLSLLRRGEGRGGKIYAFVFQRPSCPKQTQTKGTVVPLLEIAARSGFWGSRRELSIAR